MFSENLLNKLSKHFPGITIKFKDQSQLMKFFGKILFFNPDFMNKFTTTIGNTIYYPSEQYIKIRPVTAFIILLHELIHINDSNKISKFLFNFLYLTPQSLIPFAFLLFLFSWKIALLAIIFLILPLPSYFRMVFEKKAYMASLYVMQQLKSKKDYNIDLEIQKEDFLTYFKNSHYYFMWIFSLEDEFNEALRKISNNQRPFEDKVFDVLDELIEVQ